MKEDIQHRTIEAIPAVVGTALSIITLNQVVALATIAYILLQAAYLIWKWCKEAKDGK